MVSFEGLKSTKKSSQKFYIHRERGEKSIILVFGKKNVCKNISLDVKKEKRIREEKNHKNV